MIFTLEDYFRMEYQSDPKLPKIDYTARIHVTDEAVEVYIHPSSRSGNTTPTLLINGNVVKVKLQ